MNRGPIVIFLFCLLFVYVSCFGQDAKSLEIEYDKAFYAGDYEKAYQCVETLLKHGYAVPMYFREKAKMAAITGRRDEMFGALGQLKAAKAPEADAAITEVVNWDKLPPQYKPLCEGFAPVPIVFKLENSLSKSIEQSPRIESQKEKPIQTKSMVQQIPAAPTIKTGNPICYKSESGEKYHSNKYCSTRTSLSPVYDLQEVKKTGLRPCSNCWKGSPLY